jgi:Sulfotransferase family
MRASSRPRLPATVAQSWRPRSDAFAANAPSAFVGRPARPLFIGGCPRSGTTLLQVMLDMHPQLGIPRETNFIRQLWWQRLRFGDLSDVANRRRAVLWILGDRDHHTWRLRRRHHVRRKQAVRRLATAGPTIGSLVEACVRLHADPKPRWGDKRPAYSGFLGPLLAMFPDAQYVNVVRDPRAAVASQLGLGWDPADVAVPAAIARWEGAIARTDQAARRLCPDQLLDVRYEDLVGDARAELSRILAFASLPAGDVVETMISGERHDAFGEAHELVAEPVTTASIERWRERLTVQEVALVEHGTAPLMERFGYHALREAEPEPDAVRELARQRRLNRREWRRTQRDELLRRARYRKPVAAEGHD